jgi:hypothetical protein
VGTKQTHPREQFDERTPVELVRQMFNQDFDYPMPLKTFELWSRKYKNGMLRKVYDVCKEHDKFLRRMTSDKVAPDN